MYIDINKVEYRCFPINRKKSKYKSIQPIGLDTEAYGTGECFMICTSLGDTYTPEEFPLCFFTRKYRQQKFVAYNLSYDEGALLQHLPAIGLKWLQLGYDIIYKDFLYNIISKKCLSIRKGRNSIHIYDMYNFYHGTLNYNAEKYLGQKKINIETIKFTPKYVKNNWTKISDYCIQDSILVWELAKLLISKFEKYGVYPRKLYSTAYISYQYFSKACHYVTVDKLWLDDKKAVDYAMKSYNGGKFEVTEKGCGYFYEYDIVSAYPAEIANLIDITYARVVWSKKYRKGAVYAFIKCKIKIPMETHSPVAVKYGTVNTYPAGEFEKVITKKEYDYLIRNNCDVTILDAVWLHCDYKSYPYRHEIRKLVKLKEVYKKNNLELDLQTIKIFLNSLYGKFCQLIPIQAHYKASTCWQPLYASIITANVRLRVTELQNRYSDITAVHTDSVISKTQIPGLTGEGLGNWVKEIEGQGVVIGSGIYQIRDKVKFRGFKPNKSLLDMIDVDSKTIDMKETHAYSWKEIAFHNWSKDLINRFQEIPRKISVNFDRKRLWLDDYNTFREMLLRNVESMPLVVDGRY